MVDAARPPILEIIPYHYFSKASSECWSLFDSGHVYGCISLVQSVAEGLSRFVALKNGIKGRHVKRVKKLGAAGAISAKAMNAFKSIYAPDRNDIHHMNPTVEANSDKLKVRAETCVRALFEIESEVFAYSYSNSGIVPKNPRYWPSNKDGTGPVYLRFEREFLRL